jgi:hypothetical protein
VPGARQFKEQSLDLIGEPIQTAASPIFVPFIRFIPTRAEMVPGRASDNRTAAIAGHRKFPTCRMLRTHYHAAPNAPVLGTLSLSHNDYLCRK